MRKIKIYAPSGEDPPVPAFIAGLEPKFRRKLLFQLLRLAQTPEEQLREPHYKHFGLEKYRQFYELREKNKILVRIVFTVWDGDYLLLTPFVKRQSRDTMRALEQSLSMMAAIREHPESVTDYAFYKEEQET